MSLDLTALLAAVIVVGHHPINGLNLLALIVFGAILWFQHETRKAPFGCEACQGVNPCRACMPARERLP